MKSAAAVCALSILRVKSQVQATRKLTDLQFCKSTKNMYSVILERVSTRVVVVVVVTQPDRLPTHACESSGNVSEIAITEVRAAAQLSWWLK